MVCGIVIGILFSYFVWFSHRRWLRKEKPESKTGQPAAQRNEIDPTYQELDLSKMAAEDNYQSLRGNNDAGNSNDTTYTELNKIRDAENTYQSLK